MSAQSLQLLARLAGAHGGPPARLYPDQWPGPLLLRLQRVYQGWQWLRSSASSADALSLCGDGVPAAKGAVRPITRTAPWHWRAPTVVLRGGNWQRLLSTIDIDAEPAPTLLCADAGVLVAIGSRRGVGTVVHACADEARLHRYVERGRAAANALALAGCERLVPAMQAVVQAQGCALLSQQRLPGCTVEARGIDAGLLAARVHAALVPLAALQGVAPASAEPADAAWIDALCHDLAAVADWAPALQRPLAALPHLSVRSERPAVYVHGDYWLANVLFAPQQAELTGILDWERARPHGLAGFDALHLVCHAFAHWRGCSPMLVPCMIWDDVAEPVLERLLFDLQNTLGLTRWHVAELALALWLGHLHHHHLDRQAWPPGRRQDWLDEPAKAAARWLTTVRPLESGSRAAVSELSR